MDSAPSKETVETPTSSGHAHRSTGGGKGRGASLLAAAARYFRDQAETASEHYTLIKIAAPAAVPVALASAVSWAQAMQIDNGFGLFWPATITLASVAWFCTAMIPVLDLIDHNRNLLNRILFLEELADTQAAALRALEEEAGGSGRDRSKGHLTSAAIYNFPTDGAA